MTETIATIVSFGFATFALWMFIDCLIYQEHPADRVSWALLIVFVAIIGAPIYFVREYLPRRKEKRGAKQKA